MAEFGEFFVWHAADLYAKLAERVACGDLPAELPQQLKMWRDTEKRLEEVDNTENVTAFLIYLALPEKDRSEFLLQHIENRIHKTQEELEEEET